MVPWCVLCILDSGFPAQKRGSLRTERDLAKAISIDGRKSGRANSVLNQMCGRGGVARDVINDNIQTELQGKYRQAVAAKSSRRQVGKRKARSGKRTRSSERGLMAWKRKCKEGRGRRDSEEFGESLWKSKMKL